RRARQPAGDAARRGAARHRREFHGDLLRSLMGAGGRVRPAAADAGGAARRPGGALAVRSWVFLLIAIATAALVFGLARAFGNDYLFFAGYTVVQFIVLATAWNILGGYCGYVNFGTAAFFALGAYATVALDKLYKNPQICPEFWTSL